MTFKWLILILQFARFQLIQKTQISVTIQTNFMGFIPKHLKYTFVNFIPNLDLPTSVKSYNKIRETF